MQFLQRGKRFWRLMPAPLIELGMEVNDNNVDRRYDIEMSLVLPVNI
jgi:hypothetical protein